MDYSMCQDHVNITMEWQDHRPIDSMVDQPVKPCKGSFVREHIHNIWCVKFRYHWSSVHFLGIDRMYSIPCVKNISNFIYSIKKKRERKGDNIFYSMHTHVHVSLFIFKAFPLSFFPFLFQFSKASSLSPPQWPIFPLHWARRRTRAWSSPPLSPSSLGPSILFSSTTSSSTCNSKLNRIKSNLLLLFLVRALYSWSIQLLLVLAPLSTGYGVGFLRFHPTEQSRVASAAGSLPRWHTRELRLVNPQLHGSAGDLQAGRGKSGIPGRIVRGLGVGVEVAVQL